VDGGVIALGCPIVEIVDGNSTSTMPSHNWANCPEPGDLPQSFKYGLAQLTVQTATRKLPSNALAPPLWNTLIEVR
jgi:hypothetical protein